MTVKPSLRGEPIAFAPVKSTARDSGSRREGVGGSEAAAVMGRSKYRTSLQLWMEKTGRVEPDHAGEAAEWGTRNEPALLQRMAEHLERAVIGRDINDVPTRFRPDRTCEVYRGGNLALLDRLQHLEHGYMLGHIDGFVEAPDFSVEGWVEAKTASEYLDDAWGEPGTAEIPEHYFLQIVHYDEILRSLHRDYHNLPWHVGVLIGGNRFRAYEVRPDDDDRAAVVNEEAIFWTMVELDIQPPATADDGRALAQLHPTHTEEEIEASDDAETWGAELIELTARGKKDSLRAEYLRSKLKECMGDAGKLTGQGWWVTWRKSKDSRATDWRAVVEQLLFHLRLKKQAGKRAIVTLTQVEEMIEENTVETTGSRSFRFNVKQEKAND